MNHFFESVHPFDGRTLERYAVDTSQQLEGKIQTSETVFQDWRKKSWLDKTHKFNTLADLLTVNEEKLAQLITLEMGKTIRESRAEVAKCVQMIRYYTIHAEEVLQATHVQTQAFSSHINYAPLGVIFAIMPWNFPLWQALRFAVPTMLAGNTVLLKPAPNVCGSALALQDLMNEAGLDGVYQTILIDIPAIESVIANPAVHGVTLTGSNRAGASVAALAGKYVKKSVLELGGSDPFVVFKDANIAVAAQAAVTSRFQNAGQTCIAAKRWIIAEEIKEAFLEEVLRKVKEIRLGNPLDEQTTMGPLARPDLAANLSRQWHESKLSGAIELLGGEARFCQFEPVILEVKEPSNIAFQEEFFGPIATVISFKTEKEGITLANNTQFGLGASIWTADLEKAKTIAPTLEAGVVAVNQLVKSDVHLPFGGVKQSGYGRELGVYGLREFTNVQSVWIEQS
mgnify:FL=1